MSREKNTTQKLTTLREKTGMNRAQFAAYFGIPYRTIQDWELGNRQMPDYLLRLMAYKIEIELLSGKEEDKESEKA